MDFAGNGVLDNVSGTARNGRTHFPDQGHEMFH